MIRLRSSRSAIIPDRGATKAEGTWVNKKLADSHTVEPVFANTTSASATLAAQLPVFDAADRRRQEPDIASRAADHHVPPSEAAPQNPPLNSAAIRLSTASKGTGRDAAARTATATLGSERGS